jgi:hypothetical protein
MSDFDPFQELSDEAGQKRKATPAWSVGALQAAGSAATVAKAMGRKAGAKGWAVAKGAGLILAVGVAGLAATALVTGEVVGLVENQVQVAQAQLGLLDVSAQAFSDRSLNESAPHALSEQTLERYEEAAVLSSASYKSDFRPQQEQWKKQGERGAWPDPLTQPAGFHDANLGVYENNVSAMRVFATNVGGERALVISFSGSDDAADFWRDSNGLGGVFTKEATPKTSFAELKQGVDEAVALAVKDGAKYDRILIVGHSLGGYLANEAANQLARAEGDDPASPILAKTQLLTVNSLWLAQQEPPSIAKTLHFREPGELTDIVGVMGALRQPDLSKTVFVSDPAVANESLKRALWLSKMPPEIRLVGEPLNALAYSYERATGIGARHLDVNAEMRVRLQMAGEGLEQRLTPGGPSVALSAAARACAEPMTDEQRKALEDARFAATPEAGPFATIKSPLGNVAPQNGSIFDAATLPGSGEASSRLGQGRRETAAEAKERREAPEGRFNHARTAMTEGLVSPLFDPLPTEGLANAGERLGEQAVMAIEGEMAQLAAWRASRSAGKSEVSAPQATKSASPKI